MIRLILFVALLLPALSRADIFCVRVDSSVNNIPTSFSTGSTSLVLQGIRRPTGLLVDNRITSEVALNCSASTTSAPPNSNSNTIYVNASNTWALDNTFLGNGCYLRSNTGSAITSGVITVCLIGG